MDRKVTENKGKSIDTSDSKGKSDGKSSAGRDTRFLHGLRSKSFNNMLESKEKIDKVDEVVLTGIRYPIIDISSSQRYIPGIKTKNEIREAGSKDSKKEIRKLSLFDESKYSGSHQAFFEAKQAIRKPSLESSKFYKELRNEMESANKTFNKNESKNSVNERRKIDILDEAIRSNIPYGTLASSKDLNWNLIVNLNSPKKSE